MRSRVRPLAGITAIASALAVAATISWSQRWNLVTITLLVALTWSATLAVIDAWGTRRRSAAKDPEPERGAPVTFVMRVGDERPDIARTSLMLATQAGPVVVVATTHHDLLDDLGEVHIEEYVAPTIAEALSDASRSISTDAVLVLSASAFPLGDACRFGAGLLTDDVGWVVGSAPPFNHDRYAPGERGPHRVADARGRT